MRCCASWMMRSDPRDNIDSGLAAISDRYQAVVRELLGSPDKVEGLLALFDSDLRDVKDVLNADFTGSVCGRSKPGPRRGVR